MSTLTKTERAEHEAEVKRLREKVEDTEHRLELKSLELVDVLKERNDLKNKIAELEDQLNAGV